MLWENHNLTSMYYNQKCLTPESNHKETSEKPRLEDILQNALAALFKNVYVMKDIKK